MMSSMERHATTYRNVFDNFFCFLFYICYYYYNYNPLFSCIFAICCCFSPSRSLTFYIFVFIFLFLFLIFSSVLTAYLLKSQLIFFSYFINLKNIFKKLRSFENIQNSFLMKIYIRQSRWISNWELCIL